MLPRSDIILVIVAIVAAVIYLLGQPRVNVDRLARFELNNEAAIEVASSVLTQEGYNVSEHTAEVERRRNADLMRFLQRVRGRRAMMSDDPVRLQAHAPIHYYRVRFSNEESDSDDPEYEVWLTGDGTVWHLWRSGSDRPDAVTNVAVNRTALSTVLSGSGGAAGLSASELDVYSDSVLAHRLMFSPRIGGSPRADAQSTVDPPPPVQGRQGFRGVSILGTDAAVSLAEFHLSKYGLPGWDFRLDSVWTVPGERAAHVRFMAGPNEEGEENTTELVVSPTGSLRSLDADLSPNTSTSSISLEQISLILAGSLFLVFGVLLLVVFFRRLLSRAIDVKAALIDGLVFSLMFVLLILASEGIVDDTGSLLIKLLAIGGILVVGGTTVALAAFLVSGAADSLARRGWSKKLFSTSLLRQGALLNGFVGASVLRGLGVGLAILATTTLSMWIFGDQAVAYDSSPLADSSIRPFMAALGLSGLSAYIQTIVIVLTAAAVLYNPAWPRWIALGGIVAASTLSLLSQVSFDTVWITWIVSAVTGVVVAVTFWKYDLLTVFAALSSSSLVWYLQGGWLMPGSPAWIDLLIAGIFFAIVLAIGLVGVSRGRNTPGVDEYVPSYIRELRQQERMHRELEIAHQVQESFLPKEMPAVAHVDIAATCIAAEVVGGDYYDLVRIDDDRLAVVIGDVSGKGIQAAFFMTLTKGFLRTLCREQSSPAEVLRRMNRLFVESAPRGVFMSIVYGIINVNTGVFTFARAGHNPVILRRANGDANHLQPSGMAIGLDPGAAFDRAIEESRIELACDDMLVLYTDGFSEARDHAHNEFGDDQLLIAVSRSSGGNAHEILDEVCREVADFVDGAERHDDMTMLVVRFTGRHLAPPQS